MIEWMIVQWLAARAHPEPERGVPYFQKTDARWHDL